MLPDDRELLRLHVEAVWDIQLPHITQNNVDILTNSNQPQWQLYVAHLANERIHIWRSGIDDPTRQILLKRANDVLTYPRKMDRPGIEREVACKFTDQPRMTLAQAQQLAHVITPAEQNTVEGLQPGAASYFFAEDCKPLFGTILDGRLLSIAHSSRRISTACELGIETLPEARRQGYALAATILWTHSILQEGLIPIYSTLAENAASLALAEAAGYHIFAHGLIISNES